MTKLSTTVIVLIVALRLAAGWHFFNEGYKKLEPGFSSAGFLRGAKGPLAPLFQGMVTGPHGVFSTLSQPQEAGSRSAKDQAAIDRWLADYGRRAAEAARKGAPLPNDVPAAVSFHPIVESARSSWDAGIQRLGRVPSVTPEVVAKAEAARDVRLGELVQYLWSQSAAIDDARHLAWRVEQQKLAAGAASKAPFQRELVLNKSAEVWSTLQPWAKNIEQIDANFADDVVAAANSAGATASESRLRDAVAERSLLPWVDFCVTATVLTVGVLLFLGLLTPLAGVVGAGFLLSVMATQPPWVAGADTTYFFYQLVEAIALLLLAAVGAGQWAGLDGLMLGLRRRFGDLSHPSAA
jgi:uncharacterized membrane protein YphA (DoxX/SURF4 family)